MELFKTVDEFFSLYQDARHGRPEPYVRAAVAMALPHGAEVLSFTLHPFRVNFTLCGKRLYMRAVRNGVRYIEPN